MRSVNALAVRNLRANPLRTFLSGLAVALAAATIIAGSQITESLRKAILTGEDLKQIMGGLLDPMDAMMAFLGIVIMAAAAFLVFNAFAMSVTQRRQSIGALRTIGSTRQQVLRILFLEALWIGTAGTTVGILISPLLGATIIALMKQFGGGMLAFADASAAPWSVALAAVVGVGFTLLAMLFPAWQAARISPLEALQLPEASTVTSTSRRVTLLALFLAAAILIYVIIAPPGEWITFPLDGQLTALLIAGWLIGLLLLLPALIGLLGALLRRWARGPAAALAADNLRRARTRVTLTITAIAFGLLIVTGVTGLIIYLINALIVSSLGSAIERQAVFLTRLDIASGWEKIVSTGMDSVLLADEETDAITQVAGDRATLIANYFVVIPELSFIGNNYFSYMIDPATLRTMGSTLFTFNEGDVETAVPIMQAGCGVLIAPLVAAKNQVRLYDTFPVSGKNGSFECTVAGIGQPATGASIISLAAGDEMGITNPVLILVVPNFGTDANALIHDLENLSQQYPYLTVISLQIMADLQEQGAVYISASLSGLLLLAVLASALGVVNTTLVSIAERRREIGLLRAVGGTQRQVRNALVGEAALMGLIGGLLGFWGGIGLIVVFVLTYGTNSIGADLNLRAAAVHALLPALLPGVIGLVTAPLISALAAWLPVRRILREAPVEILATRLS